MIWNVSRVVEKQLARVGLNSFDVVAGTGDGGGENEGSHGIHRHFEDLCPGYVRHRCLPHIAWRTADMAIKASNLEYKHLAAYLVDGTTWTRLKERLLAGVLEKGASISFETGQDPVRTSLAKVLLPSWSRDPRPT